MRSENAQFSVLIFGRARCSRTGVHCGTLNLPYTHKNRRIKIFGKKGTKWNNQQIYTVKNDTTSPSTQFGEKTTIRELANQRYVLVMTTVMCRMAERFRSSMATAMLERTQQYQSTLTVRQSHGSLHNIQQCNSAIATQGETVR